MENFNITSPGNQLAIKVNVDTVKPALTKVYKIEFNQRVKPYLVASEEFENGSIDPDVTKVLNWKDVGEAGSFKATTLEICTYIHYLPADVDSNDKVKAWVLDPQNHFAITYGVTDTGGQLSKSYILNADDRIELLAERTGLVRKYIELL